MSKIAIIYCLCSFLCLSIKGQTEPDTFRVKLQKIKTDSSKVNEIIIYAKSILYTDPTKAWKYCEEAIQISKKSDFQYGLANAYRLAGAYNNDITGNFKIADSFLVKAVKIYKSRPDYRFKEGLGATYHNFGAIHQRTGNYLKAVESYIEGIKILDSIGNKTILPKTYNNLSSLYSFMQLFDKAEYYARAGLNEATKINDIQIISVTSVTLSDALMEQGKYDEVLTILKVADSLSKKRADYYIQTLTNYNYCTYYAYYKKDYKLSLDYALKAFEKSLILNNPFEVARTSINLAEQYLFNNMEKEALKYAMEGMSYSKALQSTDLIQRSHYLLGVILIRNGDFRIAADHLKTAAQLKDSVILQVNRVQINFLEALYQKERKEKKITQLQNEKLLNSLLLKRRNISILSLIIILVVILLFAWIITKNVSQKKALAERELEIQKQKLIEIEKQRQLEATLSVLQGEETERGRMARDLHDGLGGLLSSVKLSLANVKGNIVITGDGAYQFDRALILVDTSMKELRRVAQNMMPEALVKFGMKDAIYDFCSSIDSNKGINVKFQSFGIDKRIDSNIEISIYRIAQELINNAIKHSLATELLVQLILEENRVHLTVQDNGKGFDTEILKSSKGAGMANIRSRVESQNGQIEIMSAPDKGTEISVEFLWNN